MSVACENICFSLLFAAGDVLCGGTSATQRQKFHTDDANQCLNNKSGSHGVPNINLSNFTCLLVDFGKCCVHLATSSSIFGKLMLLYLGQEPNRVVLHLNTELQLPGTLYLTLSNGLKTLTLLKDS